MLVSLSTIKNDLDTSIEHFERLSAAMVGYLFFKAGCDTPDEVEAIIECLKGIDASIQRLQYASSKITATFPTSAPQTNRNPC